MIEKNASIEPLAKRAGGGVKMRILSSALFVVAAALSFCQQPAVETPSTLQSDVERFDTILRLLMAIASEGSADPICDNCRKVDVAIAGCKYEVGTQSCSDRYCAVTERRIATCDYHPLGTVNKCKAQWEAAADGGKIYIRDLGAGNCNADPDLYTFFNPYVGCDTCALAPQQIRCQAICQLPRPLSRDTKHHRHV